METAVHTVPPSTQAADPGQSSGRRRRYVPARWVPTILLSPAGVLLAVFVLFPIVLVGVLSLFTYDALTGAMQYVGLDNYRRILSSGELWRASINTLLYTMLVVPTVMVGGLLLALGLHSLRFGAALWRTAFFIPAASTLAAMSVVWRWMFYPESGVIDATLGRVLGLTNWLNSTELSLPAIAMVGSWQGIGTAMIMFLAGLSAVRTDLIDAARIDRANAWNRFWHVTWPALGPATIFALVVTTEHALRVFDAIQIMTKGGPAKSSETLSYLIYVRGVSYFDIGGASVVSITLLVIVLLTTAMQIRTFGQRWEKAGSR